MKRIVVALALVLGAGTLTGAAPDPWKRYAYPSDGFSFESPVEPQRSTSQHENKRGPYEIHQYSMDFGDNQAASIGVADLGPIDNPQTVLEASRDGAVRSLPDAVVKSSSLGTYAGRRAIDFEAENPT